MSGQYTRTQNATKQSGKQPHGRVNKYQGLFTGFIKDNKDAQRMGRLSVWIPEFGADPDDENGWYVVSYGSPFAGAISPEHVGAGENKIKQYQHTQSSYGFWAVPPDLENQVLIMFANGDPSRGVWMGSLYQQYMNQMVPGVAASENYQHDDKKVPVGEYNRHTTDAVNPNNITRPSQTTQTTGLIDQGLIFDDVRGTTTSSARRESPSGVVGILTPGPLDPENEGHRLGGSQFVMDDGADSEHIRLRTKTGAQIKIDETTGIMYIINRKGTGWIQISESGHVDIFSANSFSLRSELDVNIRGDRDVNIEAGRNVNMKATKDYVSRDELQQILEAYLDTHNKPADKDETIDGEEGKGTGIKFVEDSLAAFSSLDATELKHLKNQTSIIGERLGNGGNIKIEAVADIDVTATENAKLTVLEDNLDISVGTDATITTGNDLDMLTGNDSTITVGHDLNHSIGSNMKQTIGQDLDLHVYENTKYFNGGTIDMHSVNDVKIAFDATLDVIVADSTKVQLSTLDLKSTTTTIETANLNVKSATTVMQSSSLDVTSGATKIKTGSLDITSAATKLTTGSLDINANGYLKLTSSGAQDFKSSALKVTAGTINLNGPTASSAGTASQPVTPGTPAVPDVAENAGKSSIAALAEVATKPTKIDKHNVLPTFEDDDACVRNTQTVESIVSRFATYEPCAEHENTGGQDANPLRNLD